MRKIKFTHEGLASLKKELFELEKRRPDAVKELSRARELGDLSENGLYTAAKARLRSIDSHIRRISNQIKLADIVSAKKIAVEQDGKQIAYEIVGDLEADPAQNKISANSPIGSSLLNAKTGDEVKIHTPSGEKRFKILKSD
jgi:transcription elongation GreA/GreB family factor